MATDKRGIDQFPHIFKQATTSNTWVEIQLPPQCSAVKLFSHNHNIHIGFSSCTDGAAVSDSHSFLFDKKLLMDIELGRGNSRAPSIFITTAGSDDAIRVMLIE
jgi:hypothetical protein